MGPRGTTPAEVPDLPLAPSLIAFCLCPTCFQEAIWNGAEFEAYCARCDAFACDLDAPKH